jgi:hypothetical protein
MVQLLWLSRCGLPVTSDLIRRPFAGSLCALCPPACKQRTWTQAVRGSKSIDGEESFSTACAKTSTPLGYQLVPFTSSLAARKSRIVRAECIDERLGARCNRYDPRQAKRVTAGWGGGVNRLPQNLPGLSR